MRKKFGQVLLEQGLITPAQLADALSYQGRNGVRLGQALVARGHLTEDQLVISLGQALSTRVVDLSRVQPEPEALTMVRPGFASEHDLFPIAVKQVQGRRFLTVAVADPLNLRGLDELGFLTGAQIEPVLAKTTAIDMAIRRHYGSRHNHGYGADSVSRPPEPSAASATAPPEAGAPALAGATTSPPGATPRSEDAPGPEPGGSVDGEASPAPAAGAPEVGEVPSPPNVEGLTLNGRVADDGHPTERITDREEPTGLGDEDEPLALLADGALPSLGEAPTANVTAEAPGVASMSADSRPPLDRASGGTPTRPIPLTQVKRPTEAGFDAELGALIEAAGDAVHSEAIGRLERRFWALMRVLTKRGLVNNEEFLRELNEEEAAWRSR